MRTPMHAEYLIVDDHRQGEEIEHIRKVIPDICAAIFAHTLCIEAICLSDCS